MFNESEDLIISSSCDFEGPDFSTSFSQVPLDTMVSNDHQDTPLVIDGHCHGDETEIMADKSARRKLILASILCLLFMIGEIIGGALAQSLAIMTDAAHLLTDFASFMINLLALYLASRPSTKKMSFGWHRAEIVGALVSVLMIWLVTGILVYLAGIRIANQTFDVDGKIMLITSCIGIGVNFIMAFTLHDQTHTHSHSSGNHHHSHNNRSSNDVTDEVATETNKTEEENSTIVKIINDKFLKPATSENISVRAAFIHVVGDLLQSVGVVIAAIIIYLKPQYKIVDPICTFLFSILVLVTTISILRDTLNILMEAAPNGLDFNDVQSTLKALPGVIEVHNLRMWSLTTNKTAVSVHLALDTTANSQLTLKQANNLLKKKFMVHEATIQVEEFVPEMSDCEKCQSPIK